MRIRCCFQMHQLLNPALRNCGTAAPFVTVSHQFFFFKKKTSLCKLLLEEPTFPRSLAMLINVFFGLVVAFNWIFSIFKFLFEEFVNVIFPSFSWSLHRSIDPVSCAQFRVPVSSLSQPSITWLCCDSQCQFPRHCELCSVRHRFYHQCYTFH